MPQRQAEGSPQKVLASAGRWAPHPVCMRTPYCFLLRPFLGMSRASHRHVSLSHFEGTLR